MPELHSRFGYSAVSTFEQCPAQYAMRYISHMETIPTDDPANALIIGTALHAGIETDVEKAIDGYFGSYPIITDAHVAEEIKLRYWIPKVKEMLPDGLHETPVVDDNFIGTLDFLAPVPPPDGCPQALYDLYDFKYSNNWVRYRHSRQLHLYKYYYEKTHAGKYIRDMYFVFVPKVQIRPKNGEELHQFRQRLLKELEKVEIQVEKIKYDPNMVIEHLELTQEIMQATDFQKNPTKLCDWCDYKKYCFEGDLTDMLPSTNRVEINPASHKKIWIYGAPFSGKTTLADGAPTPLNLNTDGNVKTVTMPRLPIKDTMEGRQKKLAWEVFKDAIDDLEAGTGFETIVVDLLEDTYESCRLFMYKKLGIDHESDDSFRAWDKVRIEFLSTLRRLVNLPYNIILISHEDMSKDVTKRTGDKVTAIKPNIQDKIANKVAGMVDIVIRAIKNDDTFTLSTKTSNVIFGGGRLSQMKAVDVPNCWDSIESIYEAAYGSQAAEQPKSVYSHGASDAPSSGQSGAQEAHSKDDSDEPPFDVNTPAQVPAAEEAPKRRTRRTRQ